MIGSGSESIERGKITDAFSRAMHRYAADHGVPWVDFVKRQRKVKSAATMDGNAYLRGALGVAAMAASRSKGTYLTARYRRTAPRARVRRLFAVELSGGVIPRRGGRE